MASLIYKANKRRSSGLLRNGREVTQNVYIEMLDELLERMY